MTELEHLGEKSSVLGFSKEIKQTYVRVGERDVCIYVEIYYDKLAHVTMEAEKSHNLSSAS